MLRILLSGLAVFTSFLAGAQAYVRGTIMHDSIARKYLVYEPAGFDASVARPLVINLHGLGSNDTAQMVYSNFMPIADTAGFLIVCPQGTSIAGTTYWNVGLFPGLGADADDLGFISALIDSLSATYSIDHNRVYATGMSNGGYMSHYLALNLPGRIAAIASVTGTIVPSVYAAAPAPARAIPAMQVHGTADETVPYEGNSNGIHIDTLVKFWVGRNNCNPVPAVTPLPDVVTTDESTATHYVWSGGDDGSTVEFYKIAGGGHTWPGAPITIGVTNQDFSASKEIWRFFSQYSLDEFLSVRAAGSLPVPLVRCYPNPFTEDLTVVSKEAGSIILTDVTGRVVASGTSAAGLSLQHIPAGMYQLTFSGKSGTATQRVVKQ